MPRGSFYGWKLLAALWAISLIALTSLLGKAIIAALSDRIEPRYIWAGFVAIFGIGMVLAVNAATTAMLVCVATCIGIGFGGGVVTLFIMKIPAKEIGMEQASSGT